MKRLSLRFRLPLIDSVSTLTVCLLTVNKILHYFYAWKIFTLLALAGKLRRKLRGCGWFQPGLTKAHSGGLGAISGPGGGLAANNPIRGVNGRPAPVGAAPADNNTAAIFYPPMVESIAVLAPLRS